jgi:hypothetical protein
MLFEYVFKSFGKGTHQGSSSDGMGRKKASHGKADFCLSHGME